MEVTYEQILLASEPPRMAPIDELDGQRMNILVSMKVIKFHKQIMEEWDNVNTARNQLIKEIAGDNGVIKAGSPEMEKFNEVFSELLKEKTEIKGDYIYVDELPGIQISAQDLRKLFFIKEKA
jgi:hypothetical protein